MSLISCVLPSLRRRTSYSKSFNIAVIRAMGSGSCLACLCSDTTSCSIKGTSPLCLEATSFSPTGSEAAGGILVPLLFFCLGGMLCEGIASSLFFTQSPAKSPKCESAFFFGTQAQGSSTKSIVVWWTRLGSLQLNELFKNQVVHKTCFLQYT